MKNNQLQPQVKNHDQLLDQLNRFKSRDDPETVLRGARDEIEASTNSEYVPYSMDFFKASTLNEFNNGVLMLEGITDKYKTFAIEMLRQLQKDYNCQTVGEKAVAELVTINYIRTLDIQQQMSDALIGQKLITDREVDREIVEQKLKLIDILSKELDRANRHFLTAIQTLRMMKQPPLQINVKTNTAVIGQNQQIQTNHANNHV